MLFCSKACWKEIDSIKPRFQSLSLDGSECRQAELLPSYFSFLAAPSLHSQQVFMVTLDSSKAHMAMFMLHNTARPMPVGEGALQTSTKE